MPGQNGVTNGVSNTNHRASDEFDNISGTSPKMVMLDETATLNGRHDSVDGRDNPGFEGDHHDQAQGNGKTNGTNGYHSPKLSEKTETDGKVNGDNVEMVPLNPTAVSNPKNHQQNHGKSTNGSSKAPTKDGKMPLDMTNSDYFRPVNNKRKLFRGQKLYVTSDQRSDSRRWKWIAFWGGVFTFVAAALLTGILAATGIIMSKSSPSYGPPNAVYRNDSMNESVSVSMDEWNSNASTESIVYTTTKMPSTSETVLQQGILPTTFDNHTHFNDNVTSEERPQFFTERQMTHTTNVPDHFTSHPMDTNVTAVTFAVIPNVVTSTIKSETNVQDDRGRSLNKEVPIISVNNITSEPEEEVTTAPVESETLFPALENVPTEEDNITTSFTSDIPQPTTNLHLEPTLVNQTYLSNVSFITELPSILTSEVMSKSDQDQVNVTATPQPNPFDDLPSVITNNSTDLWNNSLIDEITDLLEELDGKMGNETLSTNETNVSDAGESRMGVNATDSSAVHNVTDNILLISDNSTLTDREESHLNVNTLSTTISATVLDNVTMNAVDPTSTAQLFNTLATSNENSSLSVEAKSLDGNFSEITAHENGTVDVLNSNVEEDSQSPTNGTAMVAPTLATLETTSVTDISSLSVNNVTDTAKVTTPSPVTLPDAIATNSTLEFTTLESENSTDTTSL